MPIVIPFQFYQTRINTDYNTLRRIFKPEFEFQQWLLQYFTSSGKTVSLTTTPLEELNLESASVIYSLQNEDLKLMLYIDFMQSSARTSRCFDVYFRVEGFCHSELLETLATYLEKLRHRFNGNWYIDDPQLTFDILK